ncbi:hypothetical protein [Streptomyces sp. WMMC940]|uniref:hypothetical protein n=1 Tax=Streptomyces sp. WMMC940 TaxID=3015153 RepID=UPI0022B6EEB3|nr:hypothetical protein [Streptomyces sp. WMMC940]MCZ7457883.1 hypothetical protein [Streptomyces sp. WMMC940]
MPVPKPWGSFVKPVPAEAGAVGAGGAARVAAAVPWPGRVATAREIRAGGGA